MRRKWTWDRVVRGSRGINCTGHCAFNVYVKNGIVWREEQQGDYGRSGDDTPDYGPRGCQKGVRQAKYMYGPQRVLYPMKRVGERGEGKWRRISWQQATAEIADKFLEHAVGSGPESITLAMGTQMILKRASFASLFARFAAASGQSLTTDAVYETLLREALTGAADAGGVLAYNHLSGEPIAGLDEGRPLVVRTPDAEFSLANVMRAQVYGVFATLAIGMQTLAEEGVGLDQMFAHGGVFRTAGVAQRFLAGALDAPVTVGDTAAEGGAWGMAVLAAYAAAKTDSDLSTYLTDHVFAGAASVTAEPDSADVAGFADYLTRYRAGLAAEAAAVTALPLRGIRSSNEGTA